MRRVLAVSSLGALLAACSLGYDPTRHPSARSPRGTTVVVEFSQPANIPIARGELVAVTDSGMVLEMTGAIVDSTGATVTRPRLVLASYDLPLVFRFAGASGNERVPGPTNAAAFRTAKLVARHPFGLTPPQLDTLLTQRNQSHLDRLTPRGGIRVADTSFVGQAERALQRFRDPAIARAEGYRRVGPDFPAMGEHWVNIAQVVAPTLDPSRPAILTYTKLNGRMTFLGAAYVRVLGPEESPPDRPFPPGAWHDHANGIDEETLVIASPLSMHDPNPSFRLAMVHLWTDVPNPAGQLAQNNWALPFLRLGLTVPDSIPLDAARALSLTTGGAAFYDEVIRAGAGIGSDEAARVDTLLSSVADAVVGKIRASPRRLDPTRAETLAELDRLWGGLWTCLASVLDPDALDRMDALRPVGEAGPCPVQGSMGVVRGLGEAPSTVNASRRPPTS